MFSWNLDYTWPHLLIWNLHSLRWSAIATHLPKRTDNEIKNYWNTRLKKRLTRMGIDPVTHKPKENPGGSARSRQAAVVSHMAQWETARLEAEARLVRESKLLSKLQLLHKITAPPPLPPPQPVAPPCLDVLKVWQATTTQNGFFGSPRCLESPTSTLHFSVNSCTVPTVGGRGGSVMETDAIHMNTSGECVAGKVNSYLQDRGKIDNSVQLLHDNMNTMYPMNHDHNLQGSMDLTSISSDNCYNNSPSAYVGEFEDMNKNYWNDLLNLVSSPMESPIF